MMFIDLNTIIALISLVVFTASLPGPDVFYITSNALHGEWKRGLLAWMGIVTGILIYVVTTALGLSFLFANVPVLYDVIKFCGVVYLAYLGVNFLISAFKKKNNFEVSKNKKISLKEVYIKGFFVTILNPKAVLFFTALLPQFVDADKGHISIQLLLLGLLATFIGQIIYGSYTVIFIKIGQKIKIKASKSHQIKGEKYLKIISGFIYLFFSFSLLLWKRS